MILQALIFYLFAFVLVGAGMMVIAARNPVRGASRAGGVGPPGGHQGVSEIVTVPRNDFGHFIVVAFGPQLSGCAHAPSQSHPFVDLVALAQPQSGKRYNGPFGYILSNLPPA